MEKVSDWKPIATAPAEGNLELSIYDNGEYHALVFPCRRDGTGWRDMSADRFKLLQLTHWRPWDRQHVS
jgi:hypothetical protein